MLFFFDTKIFFVWYTINMKQVIVLHDAFLKPTDAWYQSIGTLIPQGYTLVTPELPEGNLQGAEFWIPALEKYKEQFNDDTILITHGLSSLLAIKFLETLSVSIKLFVSIAGTAQVPDHKGYAPIAKTFLQETVALEKVTAHTKKIIHIWNAADPFIDPSFSLFFSEKVPGLNFPLRGNDHFVNDTEPELFQILEKEFSSITQEIIEQEKQKAELEKQKSLENIAAASVAATVTYDTALAKSISGYQGKVISELLAEAKVSEEIKKQASIKNPKNILLIIGTVLFIIAGLGLLVYGLRPVIDRVAPNFITRPIYNTFMKVEHESIIRINEKENVIETVNELQKKYFEQKVFHAILPIINNEFLILADAMKALEVPLPVGLSGKTDNWIYGTYTISENSSPAPFLALKVSDPEMVTTIMQNWEKTIFSDTQTLFGFFYELLKKEDQAGNEQVITEEVNADIVGEFIENSVEETIVEIITLEPAESTEEVVLLEEEPVELINEETINNEQESLPPNEPQFNRVVKNNIPVRFGTQNGQELYYGFITKNILVITPEPDILQPLIRRIIEQ